MNEPIETKRPLYPDFFKSWDIDPYQTFKNLFGFNSYGFPHDGRDEMRTPLWIAMEGLGITEYWVPNIANPADTEFYRQMDSCISRFIEETPVTKQTESTWYYFLSGICLGPYFQADILRWLSENYRIADRSSIGSALRYEIIRCTTGAVSLLRDRGPMFKWVIDRLMKAPNEHGNILSWLFRSPENGKIDPLILEFLPNIVRAHRRLLYKEYQFHRNHAKRYRYLRKDFCRRYKDRFQTMSSSLEWRIKEIFFFIEYGRVRWKDRNGDPDREAVFKEKARRYMVEHSGYCPFPSL